MMFSSEGRGIWKSYLAATLSRKRLKQIRRYPWRTHKSWSTLVTPRRKVSVWQPPFTNKRHEACIQNHTKLIKNRHHNQKIHKPDVIQQKIKTQPTLIREVQTNCASHVINRRDNNLSRLQNQVRRSSLVIFSRMQKKETRIYREFVTIRVRV